MSNVKWVDKHIEVAPPKRPKKITGTRFGAILGVNRWQTPFSAWCEITRTYEEPFTDSIYTIAGKTIEPKQAEYVERSYGMDIIRPADVWGKDYFKQTRGDFFSENKVFGGMWDYLAKDENGNVDTVLEMKTSKRVEDWASGEIPEYYALQAALYAYLYGVDNVIMVASFLSESDYEHPENYVPNAENTVLVPFKVSERYPNMKKLVEGGLAFWRTYVETGVSPNYDESAKCDMEALKALRTNSVNPETDVAALIEEAEKLKTELDANTKSFADKEKRLKQINDLLKECAIGQFRDGDKKVELKGTSYIWTVARSESSSIDKKALEKDGLLEKYTTVVPSYRLTIQGVKE